MSDNTFTRRQALGGVGTLIGASVLAHGQSQRVGENGAPDDGRVKFPLRLAPPAELVNVHEFEEMAKLKLPGPVFATIAAGDRQAFDRITLRSRLGIPTLNLDLSVALFGDTLFAPILIGPVSEQKQFHSDGELATVRGASAANSAMVVSSRSSVPIEQIAAQATTPLWYQVYATPDARKQIQQAVKAGCKAVCVTVGMLPGAGGSKAMAASRTDWTAVDELRQGLSVPLLIKGIMTPDDARAAIQRGAQGIVVSNHGGLVGGGKMAPIEALPSIVDAVAGKAPVLVDGGFVRGTDIFKALAFGAQAVLLGRPAMWGLAAYGSAGVQRVVELLQSELARNMAMGGQPNLKAFSRSAVKIHTR